MGKRWLSIRLPAWPIQRLVLACRRRGVPLPADRPLALVAPERGVPRLYAVNAAARRGGVRPGQALADARAILPGLVTRDAEFEADARALAALALWCRRWSPRTATDGDDAILVDLEGCTHLFGGEAGLLDDVTARLAKLGLRARFGIADGSLAAWAWARFGRGGILPTAEAAEALAELPVEALRLPAETAASLRRLGLVRVGQLAALPRASLRRRFGQDLAQRLDRLLGDTEPPPAPLPEPARFATQLALAEPIGRTEDIEAVVRHLLKRLCGDLERQQAGVRRLRLDLRRTDGVTSRIEIGASRPVREPRHLFRLLRLRLDGLDVGFGIELARIEALETTALGSEQAAFAEAADAAELARLVDRLALRLGAARIVRLWPMASHWPERAQRPAPMTQQDALGLWLACQPRPLRLLPRPQPIAVVAPIPDGPPVRVAAEGAIHRIVAASGPERLAPEWWRESEAVRPRDYYRLVAADGRGLWVYREGRYGDPEPPIWRLHGLFG